MPSYQSIGGWDPFLEELLWLVPRLLVCVHFSEDYERRDSTVDPQRAEIEVIREEGITPK